MVSNNCKLLYITYHRHIPQHFLRKKCHRHGRQRTIFHIYTVHVENNSYFILFVFTISIKSQINFVYYILPQLLCTFTSQISLKSLYIIQYILIIRQPFSAKNFWIGSIIICIVSCWSSETSVYGKTSFYKKYIIYFYLFIYSQLVIELCLNYVFL